jgi:Histidine kinase-, DNA gyrase B-, and HSP90-like ATPase
LTLELKVHQSFFKEFATKTWISPYEIIRELIENAFDEDATKVIVTILSNGNVVIEDDAGMNFDSINKFLILGSPHKSNENLSPKLKRIRTGRYGTGRLSFLTSFDNMKIKTKLDGFNKTLVIDGQALENLIGGHAQLQEVQEFPLKRNGTEIFLNSSKSHIDIIKLSKELKKLSILKYPLFEVYIKNSEHFNEWDLNDTLIIKSPDVQGYRIIVNITNPPIMGEIIIAKRPLSHDEKGIAVMVGNHVVIRSTFGFDNKLSRVTGYVKCDQLTSRFADKSALIENDLYFKFYQSMRDFIIEQVFPSLTEYEDVLITREESKIYKEIDKVMGQAVLETLQIDEEIQGFESIEVPGIEDNDYPSIDNQQYHFSSEKVGEDKMNKENNYSQHINENQINNLDGLSSNDSQKSVNDGLTPHQSLNEKNGEDDSTTDKNDIDNKSSEIGNIPLPGEYQEQQNIYDTKDYEVNLKSNNTDQSFVIHQITSDTGKNNLSDNPALSSSLSQPQQQQQTNIDYTHHYLPTDQQLGTGNLLNETSLIKKTVRKPILKKTFALKKIGYKVIPYEDETDSRYSFTSENIVFVNKAHSTYKAECERGDEFLFRHITNIVAEVVVGSKYPEAKDILEIQNKLISEAIKIHDYSLLKK